MMQIPGLRDTFAPEGRLRTGSRPCPRPARADSLRPARCLPLPRTTSLRPGPRRQFLPDLPISRAAIPGPNCPQPPPRASGSADQAAPARLSRLHLAPGPRLKSPVDAIVSDGGASTDVRRKLSTNPEILEGKKVVIWEFVERDIALGREGWEDVPLAGEIGLRISA